MAITGVEAVTCFALFCGVISYDMMVVFSDL